MYGGAGKLGRGGGGGGGGGKRNINSTFHAPPISRASAAPGGRLSLGGGGRGRGSAASMGSGPSTASVQAEETYSLVTGNPLNFAMIIRLVPDLVEEIKRAESEGAKVRIKFDANANNSNGNAINVGDKNFKFTWSREMGDLCDIYEERQSGEDGNSLLVESGGAWRKLNVQRVLDESTKNHVKMRSQEAEQKLKSRKAIVLDHQNPTMKNQIKALAAAESTPWRNFKQKKEPPFKKRKAEPPSGGPAKSVYKSAVATTTPLKGRTMDSPLSSPPEQSGAPVSPFGSGNLMKGYAGIQDSIPTQTNNKTASSEKEMPGRVMSNTVRDKPKHMAPKASDLKSLVISLLMEHHSKGMSLKGLEKAIGDAMPNSVREIEPILKQVATFQAPGRYFLKPGVEMENFKKPSSESGSSPELNRLSLVHEKSARLPVPEPTFSLRTDTDELQENALSNSMPRHDLDTIEKIDILNSSPTALSDKKVSDHSEGPAASSSDSGSDSASESDSSDSGSDSGSHSRSKSKSPVASRSGSSSDSESDASSNSKQASDEDVDIMTSDDDDNVVKSKHRSQDSGPVSPKSPSQGRPPYSESVDVVDDHVSDVVEIEKDLPEDDQEAEMAAATNSVSSKDSEKLVEGTKPSSLNHLRANESQVYRQRFYGETENVVRDGFKQQQSDSRERMPKSKFRRHSDDKQSDERPYNSKRSKGNNSSQTVSGTMNALFGESPCNSSPGRPLQGHHKGPTIQMADRTAWDGADDSSIPKGSEQAFPSRSVSESQQPDRKSFDAGIQAKVPSGEEWSGKHAENLGRGIKSTERNLQSSKGLKLHKDKSKIEAQGEDGFVGEKRPTSYSAGVGDKQSLLTESRHQKNEIVGKLKEPGSMAHSPKDSNTNFPERSPLMNDRGRILRREHSELELGEFREPVPDETPGSKKRFERENSFKKSENKPTSSEYWNSDSGKGKPTNKITSDSRKLSSPNANNVASGFPNGSLKSQTPEHHGDDISRSYPKTAQSQPQQHQSRHIEGGTNLGTSLESHQDTYSRVPVNASAEQRDPKPVVPSMKEGKNQKSKASANSNDKQKDASLTASNGGGQKRRESSSDENSCLYSKYDKEKPELKGPIKDSSQYKEYVQEFQEKYESYCSLNKILESYRDEFSNFGKDLEVYRGRDTKRYHEILGHMRASFRQCGERHKRLKKIFVVLHEELTQLKQMIKDYAAKD
ncbi:dentin sialophosphoprotein [Olea europaea var. sylvestris]|uniref:dentin sialophosphoprotein n=1 Tax=Olea europaea var. sylvestris TaxID=158386 RepID=UPI000C1D53FD|nr:dentin sialophosphoprotein [Olea europaea var. sylvestris]